MEFSSVCDFVFHKKHSKKDYMYFVDAKRCVVIEACTHHPRVPMGEVFSDLRMHSFGTLVNITWLAAAWMASYSTSLTPSRDTDDQ